MTRDRRLILIAVCLASSVLPLDFSGAAAATPAIGRQLGGSPVELAWVVNAFMLSFGSCVMAAGTLADRFGRRRVFALGTSAFVATSVGVAAAPTIAALDVMRLAQGVAAAMTLASGSAALAQEFEGHERTRAFGFLGATFGIGLALGPSVGGLLLDVIGWRAVFLAGAVVGLIALVVAVPRMRESSDPDAKRLDVVGTLTFTIVLSAFTSGLLIAPDQGWSSCPSIAIFATSAAALVAFVAAERRIARPMLDLSLFRYPRFVGIQMLPVACACCYVVLLVLLPTRFIGIEQREEWTSGAIMIALSAPMAVIPLLASRLTRVASPGVLAAAGLVVAAIGLVWLAWIPPCSSIRAVVLPMFVIGIGTGCPWGLMDGLSVSVVPMERAGMATGIFGTTRIVSEGVTLAAARALLATLASTRVAAGMIDAPGSIEAYGRAFHVVCLVLAAATLASAAIVFLCVRPDEP